LSKNTIEAYCGAAKQYAKLYGNNLNKKNLLAYKGWLTENFKPKTVNLRILGINKYCNFLKLSKLKLTLVKIQQKTFIENVISDADYVFFKNRLKKDERLNWYFVVRYLAATGARISELIQIKCEHIKMGFIDIYGKGGKVRRIYIPKTLAAETLAWLSDIKYESGCLFLNRFGKKITARGVAHRLKDFAKEYDMNAKVVYPHSFRHRFAKNFLAKYNDISLLADLMGHESIETTRIYLRKTANEQQEIVNKIITW
jgi:integrase